VRIVPIKDNTTFTNSFAHSFIKYLVSICNMQTLSCGNIKLLYTLDREPQVAYSLVVHGDMTEYVHMGVKGVGSGVRWLVPAPGAGQPLRACEPQCPQL